MSAYTIQKRVADEAKVTLPYGTLIFYTRALLQGPRMIPDFRHYGTNVLPDDAVRKMLVKVASAREVHLPNKKGHETVATSKSMPRSTHRAKGKEINSQTHRKYYPVKLHYKGIILSKKQQIRPFPTLPPSSHHWPFGQNIDPRVENHRGHDEPVSAIKYRGACNSEMRNNWPGSSSMSLAQEETPSSSKTPPDQD